MSSTPTSDEDGPPSQAAHAVRALLERHGIPKHRQSAYVGEFFNLSRTAAHRRVHSTAAWTLEELQALGEAFGETLPQMLGGGRSISGTKAILRIGEIEATCRVWFAPNDELGNANFVAIESAGKYTVVPASAAAGAKQRRIAKFEVDDRISDAARVAVLDDERDVTDAICAGLRQRGYDATGFTAEDALEAKIRASAFDAYVLDWKLRSGTALPIIELIRARPQHAAIVVLSGRMRDGTINTREVGEASSTHDFQILEKPGQMDFIVSTLMRSGLEPPPSSGPR
jgi:ActR/RegA family two-component response regulator